MKTKLTALILLAAGILSSQERFDYKVRSYFFAGFAGDAASLEKGMKICEDILTTNPQNAEAMVWHGAGQFYQSGVAFRNGGPQSGISCRGTVRSRWMTPRSSPPTTWEFGSFAVPCFSPPRIR